MFVCAAVIGQQSQPLWIEAFTKPQTTAGHPADPLAFYHIVHCALDGIDEKLAAPKRTPSQQGGMDAYLGQLHTTEVYSVHGLVTNTKAKLIVILPHDSVKEDMIRLVLNRIHAAFTDAVSNPFYEPGQPITSKRFQSNVVNIIANFKDAGHARA